MTYCPMTVGKLCEHQCNDGPCAIQHGHEPHPDSMEGAAKRLREAWVDLWREVWKALGR